MIKLAIEIIQKEKEKQTGKLDLGNCGLTDFPKELFELEWLEELNFSDLYFDYNTREWEKSLNTGKHNSILVTKFPENIKRLKNLKILRFGGYWEKTWMLSDCDSLSHLKSLEILQLRENKIKDIQFLKELENLTILDLSVNLINDISPLRYLKNLINLSLRSNKIVDIKPISDLHQLRTVSLIRNEISDIQPLIPLLKRNIKIFTNETGGIGISLYKNPISNPPLNIVNRGAAEILTYFEQKEKQGSEKHYEARIVIVGEPRAGKTTLFRKLKDENILVPDPKQSSTHGISINQERIFKHTKGVDIQASIWDFGGQDTQNYLHQYFYAKDNLFVLVCDQRAEKTRFDYWFEMITRLCAESRIIVVRNLNERVTACQSLNLKEYEERFPGIRVSSVDVDFKVNDVRWSLLIQTIEENLSVMERVNQEIPRTWKPIRETLQQLKEEKRCHISLEEFQNICSNNGLPEENYQNQCLDYLHWLGYALHYTDTSLTNTIFINPEWITTGLYEILREENYKPELKGRFSQNDILTIWKGKQYTLTDRIHLLNLLLKDRFEVCYKVDGSDNYLVPILISNEQKEPSKPESKPYTLRFKFPFMPFGFFSRLIVRLYDKIWDDYVWLTGVWLKDENKCKSRMEHFKDINTGEEVFEVSIYGEKKERKELLAEIRNEISHIRKLLFPNLIIEEQIPCFCESCLNLKTPYFHSRNDLERMAERNQYLSQCKQSGELISISQLLDSIIDTNEILKQFPDEGREIQTFYINGNALIGGEGNQYWDKPVFNFKDCNIDLQGNLNDLSDLLIQSGKTEEAKELMNIAQALEQVENSPKEEVKKKGIGNKLKRILNDLGDKESKLYRSVEGIKSGIDIAKSIIEAGVKVLGWLS